MDIFTKSKRSEVMSRIRSKENESTELKVLALLKEFGITGWRRDYALFGRPDITFPKLKVAIFVDGCFWHGCSLCWKKPKSNKKFWIQKIEKNRKRDKKVTRQLRLKGWSVIRIKECRLKKYPLLQIKRIQHILSNRALMRTRV